MQLTQPPDQREWNQCAILKEHLGLKVSDVCSHLANRQAGRLDGLCNARNCHHTHWRERTGVVMDALRSVLQLDGFGKFTVTRDEDNTPELHDRLRAMVRSGIPVPVLTRPPGAKLNHYVLIAGYDRSVSQYLIWDPATIRGGLRWVSLSRWDEVGSWIGIVEVEAIEQA